MTYLAFLRDNALWLLAGFLLSFTSSYGQTYFISIFAGEIMSDFGLSHGQWGGIYTVGTTASAIAMIWVGGLTDRFRVRNLGTVVMVLLALACLAMAAVPNALALVFVIFALRFTGQGMMSHLAMVAMARWFVATRGKALSISSMGFAVGQSVLPLGFVALLAIYDWRWLWVLAAGFVVIIIPVMAYLLRLERTPQSIAESSQVFGMSGRHWTRGDVMKHWLFWLMVPALLGPPAWGTALFFQQVHLSEVKGWTLAEFVALFPLFTVTMIATTFASGWAIDRFGTGRVVPFYMVPFAAAFVVLSQAQGIGGAAVGMVLFGIGSGMQTTVPGAFWAEYYGSRHIGSIKAVAAAIMVFGSAIGPGVTGIFIDFGVDFPAQMIAIAIYFGFAAICGMIGVARARPALVPAA